MAIIHRTDGKHEVVDPEIGAAIWKVLNGEIEPSPEQAKYCETVEKIDLNWRKAPDSYIKAHFDTIIPMALSDWMLEVREADGHKIVTGRVSRPQPGDDFAWNFAKRWGLWYEGKKTELVDKYEKPIERTDVTKKAGD